jgi:hypothetical protein
MLTHRFGRKIKLPSTVAIKHQILKLMLQDCLKAQVLNTTAIQGTDVDGREDVSVEAEYHG